MRKKCGVPRPIAPKIPVPEKETEPPRKSQAQWAPKKRENVLEFEVSKRKKKFSPETGDPACAS